MISEAIGGYFELCIEQGCTFHAGAYKLNSGRNALRYLLRNKRWKSLQVPRYICSAITDSLLNDGVEIKYYRIEEDLTPVSSDLDEKHPVLLVNYFGLLDQRLSTLIGRIDKAILDNCQSFFSQPPSQSLHHVSSIYSPRKFFGVPDGGYLYAALSEPELLEHDCSHQRMMHLLKRLECGPESGFSEYAAVEKLIDSLPLRSMSIVTDRLLGAIDYQRAKDRRVQNFEFVHSALSSINEFRIDEVAPALCYPLLTNKAELRERLLRERIFIPRYWPESESLLPQGTWEYEFGSRVLPLPIDHRYGRSEMQRMVELILG